MANQEFQQSAARAESYVERGGAQNATVEVYNELIKIENGKGSPQQKASQEAEYLKAVLDQNKVLKQHGFPEFDITENGQSLTIKATDKTNWYEQPLPPTAYGKNHENLGKRTLTSENVSDQPLTAEKPQMAPETIPTSGTHTGRAEQNQALNPSDRPVTPYDAPKYVNPDGSTSTELPRNPGDRIQTGIVDDASPEGQARKHLHRMRDGAIDISSGNIPPGPVWEGQESRILHYGNSNVNSVNFEIKLPYGVRSGDVVEGRIYSNETHQNSDVVKGRVVSVNGQLHFQGDENILVKDATGKLVQTNNRQVGPYEKQGPLDIPLTLHN